VEHIFAEVIINATSKITLLSENGSPVNKGHISFILPNFVVKRSRAEGGKAQGNKHDQT